MWYLVSMLNFQGVPETCGWFAWNKFSNDVSCEIHCQIRNKKTYHVWTGQVKKDYDWVESIPLWLWSLFFLIDVMGLNTSSLIHWNHEVETSYTYKNPPTKVEKQWHNTHHCFRSGCIWIDFQYGLICHYTDWQVFQQTPGTERYKKLRTAKVFWTWSIETKQSISRHVSFFHVHLKASQLSLSTIANVESCNDSGGYGNMLKIVNFFVYVCLIPHPSFPNKKCMKQQQHRPGQGVNIAPGKG